MRVIPIQEILKMDLGEKVPSLKGQIKKVYDQTTGTNDKGPWAIQNIELADPDHPQSLVKVKLFNQKPVEKAWMNKTLYIESAQGEKGIKHVALIQDTYKWKEGQPIKKIIEVREEAIVGLGEGQATESAPVSKPANLPTTHAPANQTSNQPPPDMTPQRPVSKTAEEMAREQFNRDCASVKDARKAISRAVNAFELIMTGVDHLAAARQREGRAITPEQFQGTCSSIFISLDRSGIVGALPTGAIEKYLPPKKEFPENNPQA